MADPNPKPSAAPLAAIDPTSPVGTALTDLASANDALKTVLKPEITPAERKRVVKVKHKAEGLMGTWFQLAIRKKGLAPMNLDPAQLLATWQQVEQLKALVPPLRGTSRSVEDTVLVTLADLWKAVMAIYGAAQFVSGDPEVAAAVAQMKSALSTGPKKQKAVKTDLSTPISQSKSALKKAAIAEAKAELVKGPAAGQSPGVNAGGANGTAASTPKASS